jgi:hypothetical protein
VKTNRLGCLTGAGLATALITFLIVAGVALARGGVLFSPGGLNAQTGGATLGGVRSHAETAGRCAACHTAPWARERMVDRCLDCHDDLLTNPRGFHSVMLAENGKNTCNTCHTEHNGPQAAMTALNLQTFPHDQVGFSLQAHQQNADGSAFACSDCHVDSMSSLDPLICADCHSGLAPGFMNAHLVAFQADCLACHDGLDSLSGGFDHSWTGFSLAGEHINADCSDCHVDAGTLIDFGSAPQDCFACHAQNDAHAGRFGQDCGSCHDSESWEQADFDHNLTGFPLEGGHAGVACQDCHLENRFVDTPQDCFACHAQDDAHNGEFGPSCDGCHTPSSWQEADFDHSQTDFPLTGGHLQAACEGCHVEGVFAGTPQECAACHAEPQFHAGMFASACADCHTTDAWRPARFDQAHTFPIAHGESGWNDCQVCHPSALQNYTCYGCHEHDPGEIDRKHREEGISNFENCVRCHSTGREEEGEGD